MTVATTSVSVGAAWTDLGAGPMLVQAPNKTVYFEIADVQPSASAPGFTTGDQPLSISTTSHVWSRRHPDDLGPSRPATMIVEVAPISAVSGGGGSSAPTDVRATGLTLAATLGAYIDIPINSQGLVGLRFAGLTASGATITYYSANDATATPTSPISAFNASTGTPTPNRTTDGETRIPVAGRTTLRLQVTTAGTGSVTVSYNVSAIPGIVSVDSPIPNSSMFADRSGATPTTVGQFGSVAGAGLIAAATRSFLRISNPNAMGVLNVFDKVSGTPVVGTNTFAIQPGGIAIYDSRVPANAIQIAGSLANLKYEAAEG